MTARVVRPDSWRAVVQRRVRLYQIREREGRAAREKSRGSIRGSASTGTVPPSSALWMPDCARDPGQSGPSLTRPSSTPPSEDPRLLNRRSLLAILACLSVAWAVVLTAAWAIGPDALAVLGQAALTGALAGGCAWALTWAEGDRR